MHRQATTGRRVSAIAILAAAGAAALAVAGPRERPPLPKITAPVMFGTPEADRILEAMQVFPPDNPWNQDVSKLPVHPDSGRMIASIGADKNLGYNLDMGFILVPPDQKRVEVKLVDYPKDSDPGPYPVPDNAPIENWPLAVNEDKGALTKPGQTLEDLQRNGTGDRHVIVVDPVNGKLYEFWQGRKTDAGWQASNEATFDLKTGALRPERWTSSDAAGLPVFPAVVRYDECERGIVDHAMRFTVRRTRRGYVLPATHWASPHFDKSFPRMGERFRLKASFDTSVIPEARPRHPGGAEDLRHVRGRQRQRVADVHLARPAAPGARDAQAGEGLGLRGGGDRRPRRRGRAEVSAHEAVPGRLRRARAGRARPVAGPLRAGARRARARRLLRPRRRRAPRPSAGTSATARAFTDPAAMLEAERPDAVVVVVPGRADGRGRLAGPRARPSPPAREAARGDRRRSRSADRRRRERGAERSRTRSPSTAASPRSSGSCAVGSRRRGRCSTSTTR